VKSVIEIGIGLTALFKGFLGHHFPKLVVRIFYSLMLLIRENQLALTEVKPLERALALIPIERIEMVT
jgi:hypothetical protein